MASINGISIKSLKQFVGHEGEPLFQGSFYLNGKKIGFWSQGDWGAGDDFRLDGGWPQEKALNDAVKALYPEKAIHGEAQGTPYVIEYDLSFLISDLLDLMDDEKAFKKAVKAGFDGIVVATDGYHQATWQLPAAYTALSDEDLLNKMGSEIARVKESFYPNKEHTVKIYRSAKDFVVGEPLDLKGKKVDEVLKDASERSKGAGAMDRHLGKEELDI